MRRVGGIIFIKVDGQQFDAKGAFTYNLGVPMKEEVVGSDGVHGFKEIPRAPFIEGEITDSATLDSAALQKITNATVTLELANGKVVVLRDATFTGTGDTGTEEGNIAVKFTGYSAKEIT